MVILGFCLLCPPVYPHELRHFILEKTGLFFTPAREEGREGERRSGRYERRGAEREGESLIKQTNSVENGNEVTVTSQCLVSSVCLSPSPVSRLAFLHRLFLTTYRFPFFFFPKLPAALHLSWQNLLVLQIKKESLSLLAHPPQTQCLLPSHLFRRSTLLTYSFNYAR